MKKVIKTFDQFVNEEFFYVPANTGGASTNYKEDQTSLKQAYPDAESASDNDAWNPSIINKNAEEEPSGDVAFVSRKDKTKGGSIDTFGNRTKEDRPGGGSIYGQSGVAESTELDEGGLGDNEVAGQRVYTQTVDKSKQGYQDAMYYGDDEIDNHGPECDCTDCLEKYA
jgi:hypothetical protein